MAKRSSIRKTVNNKLPILLGIISFLGLLFFYIHNSNKQYSSLNTGTNLVEVQKKTNTPEISTKIIAEPLLSNQFSKTFVTEDTCNNPIGLITYSDNKGNYMKINSLLTPQRRDDKDTLLKIKSFLQNNKLYSYQDINSFEAPFHDYCGGTTNLYIKEIRGITYPNTDKVRAILVYTTQDILGKVTVVVFAQKNNDIIQLRKYLDDKVLYQPILLACSESDIELREECYRSKLLQNTNLQEAASSAAKDLTLLFVLK